MDSILPVYFDDIKKLSIAMIYKISLHPIYEIFIRF